MVLRWLVTVAAVFAAAACGGKSTPPPEVGAPVAAPAPRVLAPHETITATRMMKDVEWLCDPAREGRGFYQPGGRAAADWIERQFRDAGLDVSRQAIRNGADNVIGVLAGGDSAVIVAAHYDHMGIDDDGAVHPGADDNASGVAVMLAVMRAVADLEPGHTVVFIAFGAEEDGLRGSNVYVHDPLWPLDRTALVVNFDMVGRNLFEMIGDGRRDAVAVVGLDTDETLSALAKRAAEAEDMYLLSGSAELIARFGFDGRTDDWWFRKKDVRTVHFSTGLHRDYHKPTDTPDKLRPRQLTRIARIATRIVVDVAELGPAREPSL
jgi:predicted small lipoprotein YifL